MRDDRLRLIFTCCHPALRTEHAVALTLRLLGGLSVEEVARSFLVSEAAMAKRLVRAKYKIKAAKIPYRIPNEADLPERLLSVLSVLYLIYNAGLDGPERTSLRSEAIRLARALVELMPDEPEAAGLLALLLLSESRVPARTAGGALVLLRDQDRTKWDRTMIDEGHAIVRACIRRGQPGPFQLQAAIQAVHCAADSFRSIRLAADRRAVRSVVLGHAHARGCTQSSHRGRRGRGSRSCAHHARLDRAGPGHVSPDACSPRHDVASAWTTRGRGGSVQARRPPRSDRKGPPVPHGTDRGVGRGRSLVTRSWIHAVESSLVMIRVDSGRRAR